MKTEILPYHLLGIHSQSTRPGSPLDLSIPEEQAFDSRVAALPGMRGGIVLSNPLEDAYKRYMRNVLHVNVPHVMVPDGHGSSLSQKVIKDHKTINQIKTRQQEGGVPYVLSVFDVTDDERKLLERLDKEIQVFPEVDFDQAVLLGDKAGFREFCAKHDIPQFPGVVVKTKEELETFLKEHPKTIVKNPVGTGGEGLTIITEQKPPSAKDFAEWEAWIKKREGKGIVAEIFNPGGSEYAVHVYIDPITNEGKVTGIYNQLVKKTEDGQLSHYGVIYPIADPVTESELHTIGTQTIIPALQTVGYTGPASIDALKDNNLVQPFHFIELNARAGANMYLHRMAEQVGESLYGKKDVAFMSLVSLPHEITSFAELSEKFADVLTPKENGTLVFTNPGRHAFGYYDVTAVSPYGVEEAQKILFEGLSKIWGPDKAQEFFDKIYQRT